MHLTDNSGRVCQKIEAFLQNFCLLQAYFIVTLCCKPNDKKLNMRKN